MKRFTLLLGLTVLLGYAAPRAEPLPEGYWPLSRSQPILDKTLTIRLAPDLSGLDDAERQALDKLLEVGRIFHDLYLESRHHQARGARRELQHLDADRGSPPETQALLRLYRIFRGPIATTLDNRREAFLPVDPVVPGKNVYPWGVTRDELDAFLAAHPESRRTILAVRTVVRRTRPGRLRLDLGALHRNPALVTLHPGLRERLTALSGMDAPPAFYAVPYSVAWPAETLRASRLLFEAAALLDARDPAFAQYLRNRARDFLADDYEAGDASWVTGRFGKLNAQIGAYEVYDDELFATKAFYSTSLLLRDAERSASLRSAIQGLQAFEDALPYPEHKRVREDIPVGVYNVIADFGQSRGTNTASILPNESYIVRKYGRTILLRYNIMTHPDLFQNSKDAWDAAVAPEHHNDFVAEGNFHRTLWHEIGHYLGPDVTRDGRTVDDALEENSSTFEEMKADLVSLFVAPMLHERGYYDDAQLRHVYASGIRRVLRKNRPRRAQAYATMQLMQLNWFLDRGLVRFDRAAGGVLHIDYARYPEAVRTLLERILALQFDGDKAASDAFIDRWTTWDPELHEVLADHMRRTEKTRYRLVYYGALGE